MNRAFIYAYAGHILLSIAAFLLVVQTGALHPEAQISIAFKVTVCLSAFLIYRLAYYGLRWQFEFIQLLKRKEISVCLLLLLIMIPFIRTQEIKGMLLMLLCCLAYFVEYKNWKGLRSLPIVKSIWLAFVWTITTVVIPLNDNLNADVRMLITERFLFILPLCIIYNLRDNASDSVNGIHTITRVIGAGRTKKLSLLLLAINAYLIFIHHYIFPVSVALTISLAITAVIIIIAKEDGHQLFYTFAVDASMILQSVLVIGAVTVFC